MAQHEYVHTRGCGRRVRGGLYACLPLHNTGLPVEYFLIDPPIPIDPENVPRRGVRVIGANEKGRKYVDLLDWVSPYDYPYPADFVEEARVLGISRRIPPLVATKLQPGSRLLLVHAHACCSNLNTVREHLSRVECHKGIPAHSRLEVSCAGLWWHAVHPEGHREGIRTIPCGATYRCTSALVNRALWGPGIFIAAPIACLQYVRRSSDERDSHALAEVSRIPVEVVDE